MKFFSTLSTLALVATSTCLAQGVTIGFPADGDSISLGSITTVSVLFEDTSSSLEQVAIVIGLQSGSPTSCFCPPPENPFGPPIVYVGPYNPQPHPPTPQLYQTFSFIVSEDMTLGSAQLSATYLALVRAALTTPVYKYTNITVNVV